jgi:predicted metal-dependent hydrolase
MDLEEGVRLFNERKFWEAHEAWERIWLGASGEEKQFLQGLIQLAAAYHHVQRGTSPRGAVRLFDASLRRLAPFAEKHDGIERAGATALAAKHREQIANGESTDDFRYPKLRFHAR